ncbi:MAG: M20 family metallopeptidase [Bacilli bacterium]
MSELLYYLEGHKEQILQDLERLVRAESPTNRKDLVDRCGLVLQDLFQKHLGLTAEVISKEEVGNQLRFTYGEGEESILILSHFDTVWDEGKLTYRVEGNKAYGPGIFDMKGGIIQSLWAVKALKELNASINKKIVFLFSTDEETGSDHSRALIEEEAKECVAVLVPEPPVAHSGSLKTARKGVGMFTLNVQGVSSHAGNHHEEGVSAVKELAHQILAIESLTNYERGTTLNVGIIQGGSRINVVPDEATAEIDVRVTSFAEAQRMKEVLENLTLKTNGARLSISGDVNRPPMERSDGTVDLFQKAKHIAKQVLGYELKEESVGGGSDGNFTAALGIPTLDGLGAKGDGPHAIHEHILIDQLPVRAALFAHLLIDI